MAKADISIANIEKTAELTAVFLVPFILALFFFIAPSALHSAMTLNSSVLHNVTMYAEFQYSHYTGFFKDLFNNPAFILGIIFAVLTWFSLAIYYLFERPRRLLKLSILFQGIAILAIIYLITFGYSNFLYTTTSEIIFGFVLITVIAYWCFCACAFRNIDKHIKP